MGGDRPRVQSVSRPRRRQLGTWIVDLRSRALDVGIREQQREDGHDRGPDPCDPEHSGPLQPEPFPRFRCRGPRWALVIESPNRLSGRQRQREDPDRRQPGDQEHPIDRALTDEHRTDRGGSRGRAPRILPSRRQPRPSAVMLPSRNSANSAVPTMPDSAKSANTKL